MSETGSNASSDFLLTAQLNKSSKKIHTLSNSLVNAKLVALLSDRVTYAKALACFYYVFAALEAALDQALKAGEPDVLRFNEPLKGGLYRAAGFREDLEYYLGPEWQAVCGPKSGAIREYEAHLSGLASRRPRLLLAHAYTQHLAAASGGQMIKRWARKYFGLPPESGTAAFGFRGESNNTLRSQFKHTMDEWGRGLSEAEVAELTSEHLAAFAHNNAIIAAFPVPPAALLRGLVRVAHALLTSPRLLPLVVAAAVALAAAVLAVALAVPWVASRLRGG